MTKEELFNKYEPLCTYVFAKRFHQKCYEQFKEDFIQEGRLALWVALNKELYDEGDSKRLFNYFYSVIYHRMICFARTCNKANSVVSGSTPICEGESGILIELIDSLPDDTSVEYINDTAYEERIEILKKNLKSNQHREILDMYIGGCKQVEISEKYGFSRQRVQQIISKIQRKYKELFS